MKKLLAAVMAGVLVSPFMFKTVSFADDAAVSEPVKHKKGHLKGSKKMHHKKGHHKSKKAQHKPAEQNTAAPGGPVTKD